MHILRNVVTQRVWWGAKDFDEFLKLSYMSGVSVFIITLQLDAPLAHSFYRLIISKDSECSLKLNVVGQRIVNVTLFKLVKTAT